MPSTIKSQLLLQQTNLNNYKKKERYHSFCLNEISTKVKKRSEAMVMETTDGFRMKKQLNDIMYNKEPLEQRLGTPSW